MISQTLINLLGATPPLTTPAFTAAQVQLQGIIAGQFADPANPRQLRVFLPGDVPEGTTAPYVVVEQADGDAVRHMAGQSGIEKGRAIVRVFHKSQPAAKVLCQQIGQLLDCLNGVVAGITVQGIFQESGQDLFESPVHADERGNPCEARVFKVWQVGY